MTNGKIDVTQSARKVTLLGIAVLFFYLAYDAFTASGWEINDAFWMGIVMVAIAVGCLGLREYYKWKYGAELEVTQGDLADITDMMDELQEKLIGEAREYRDFIRDHAEGLLATIDIVYQIGATAGMDEEQLDRVKALREKLRIWLDQI